MRGRLSATQFVPGLTDVAVALVIRELTTNRRQASVGKREKLGNHAARIARVHVRTVPSSLAVSTRQPVDASSTVVTGSRGHVGTRPGGPTTRAKAQPFADCR